VISLLSVIPIKYNSAAIFNGIVQTNDPEFGILSLEIQN
jgi:hypothetical protein